MNRHERRAYDARRRERLPLVRTHQRLVGLVLDGSASRFDRERLAAVRKALDVSFARDFARAS